MDVENIYFGILKARGFEGISKKNVLLRAATVALEQMARSLGNVVAERWAAISMPPLYQQGQINCARRERVRKAVETLTDWGYGVITVPEGENAADNALCRVGEAFITNAEVELVVLGTGDGKEPFATLIDSLVAAGKRVHCVSYCHTSLAVKRRGDVSYSLLVEDVRKILGASIGAPAAQE